MVLWQKAREFAIQAHGDQKYNEEPYAVHLDEVVGVLKEFGYADFAQCIIPAYLHDVVEDTPVTIEDIKQEFGSMTAEIVAFLTDEPGPNRKARKEATYALRKSECIKGTLESLFGMRVKLADRIANIRRSAGTPFMKMYLKEKDAFRDAYSPMVDPSDPMWAEYDRLTNEMIPTEIVESPDETVPTKIIVESSDGTRVSLSGEKLKQYLEDIRKVIVFAQEKGYESRSWRYQDWDAE